MNYRKEVQLLSNSEIKNEIYDLKKSLNKFIVLMRSLSNIEAKVVSNLLEAQRNLSICRNIVYNLIDKENNELIQIYSTEFDTLIESLGRIDRKTDEILKDTLEQAENLSKIANKSFPLRINRYKNHLWELIVNLVILPLKRGYGNFLKSKKELQNRDLLEFFIFAELFHTAQIMGSPTADKYTTSTINLGKLKNALNQRNTPGDEGEGEGESENGAGTEPYIPDIFNKEKEDGNT